ncbi:recombinase family protein [Edaphobacter paludis]|uniref:Recombinase family protein n=1 Tax=Edaphobacter paludis TaxID=3035702 RepID=A0AAU7DAR5_9BACT
MTPVAVDSNLTVVGAYARFSNDGLQRDSSIDDQFTTCTQAAEEKGWVYDPSLQFSDAGLSGALMSTRDSLQVLLKLIESDKAKSYHGFMFDDTSRLGRNLSEVLQFCKLCQFHGVFLYFVNQQLDSRDPNFYELIKNYASSDENFLKSLGHAVIRGQKGRIKAGMIHGGRYYGYKGEAILDPLKRSTASKKAIKGVKLVRDEVEAEVVRTIYRWAEEGLSLMRIARECITANFPRPERKGRAKTVWTVSAVSQILHSKLYCGYLSYGKTTNARHPVTGRVENRSTDKSKWMEIHFPDLAIVTVEQWERVQAITKTHTNFGAHRLGGMGRRDKSAQIPLFSGLLICGSCGGAYVVTDKNLEGNRVLQCKNYRFYKTCDNPLTLIEQELEQRLIDYIVNRLLVPENLNFAVERFHTELNARIAIEELQCKESQASKKKLIREQSRLELELKNIINSLREIGPEESLKSEFQRIQGRLNLLKNELQENITSKLRPISPKDAHQFVNSRAERLSELLLANRISAQRVIRQFIGPLTVSRHPEGHLPMCRIQGGLRVCN